jgi:hypothetical protein
MKLGVLILSTLKFNSELCPMIVDTFLYLVFCVTGKIVPEILLHISY